MGKLHKVKPCKFTYEKHYIFNLNILSVCSNCWGIFEVSDFFNLTKYPAVCNKEKVATKQNDTSGSQHVKIWQNNIIPLWKSGI